MGFSDLPPWRQNLFALKQQTKQGFSLCGKARQKAHQGGL
jgi:hypothetical protein